MEEIKCASCVENPGNCPIHGMTPPFPPSDPKVWKDHATNMKTWEKVVAEHVEPPPKPEPPYENYFDNTPPRVLLEDLVRNYIRDHFPRIWRWFFKPEKFLYPFDDDEPIVNQSALLDEYLRERTKEARKTAVEDVKAFKQSAGK
jgi:hypothetical protein